MNDNPLTNGRVVSLDYDAESYHRIGGKRGQRDYVMSHGGLRSFRGCPSRWLAGYESKDTDSREWGRLLDTVVLTPHRFRDRYAIKPLEYKDSKTGEMKPWNGNSNVCKEWIASHSNRELISMDTWKQVEAAAKALKSDPRAADVLDHSHVQVYVACEFKDSATGITVPIKCLLDLVPKRQNAQWGKWLFDLKTSQGAGNGKWKRDVFNFGYHVQASFYCDAYESATGEDRPEFGHIVQESFEPWQVGRRMLGPSFLELGRQTYLHDLKVYCQCLKTGVWPDYDSGQNTIEGFTMVEPEGWMVTQNEVTPSPVHDISQLDTPDPNDLIP